MHVLVCNQRALHGMPESPHEASLAQKRTDPMRVLVCNQRALHGMPPLWGKMYLGQGNQTW